MVGRTLKHYEIIEPLGAGGMGEVYRAHDTILKRDVAIKVLPEEFAADQERLARFESEAKVLASLNHANIAAIYGLEEAEVEGQAGDAGSVRFIAMECVEGETLAEKLDRGRLEVEKALGIARQIAEALEAAHARGIIHRDLKPANVVITSEGQAKVLDFGLAKSDEWEVEASDMSPDFTESPTVLAATQAGIILGTAAYMSPEQARGKPLDKRTDIWSFGCVLYEMLSGQRAFGGETVSDTMAAILKEEPDWGRIAVGIPNRVRDLIRRCLQKDRRLRLRDIGDAWVEIETTITGPVSAVPGAELVAVQAPLWRRALPWTVAGVAIAALVATLGPWSRTGPTTPVAEVSRSTIRVEDGYRLFSGARRESRDFFFLRPSRTAFVLSPDGRYLVYSAAHGLNLSDDLIAKNTQLFRRAMNQDQAVPIPGTEGGVRPFFSPDSQSIGFQSRLEGEEGLKRVSIMGGDVRTIAAKTGAPCGATWTVDDTIIFSGSDGLTRTSSTGEGREFVTLVDKDGGESRHCSPQLMPGGKAILFTVEKGDHRWGDAEIVVQSLDTGIRTLLARGAADPRYVPSGHLVYAEEGALIARTFDPETLSVGDPVQVIDDVMQAQWASNILLDSGIAQFSFSDTGSLVYVPGGVYPVVDEPIVWLDRAGVPTPIELPVGGHHWPRVSPDGRYLAYARWDLGEFTLSVYDIQRGMPLPSMNEPGGRMGLAWSPDSEWIAYSADGGGGTDDIFLRRADGNGEPQRLTRSDHDQWVLWWPKPEVLAYAARNDIWLLPMGGEGEREGELFLDQPSEAAHAAFSPDGSWVAFHTYNQAGRSVVHLQPFPGGGPGISVVVDAQEPMWSPAGGELFYRKKYPGLTPREFMVVEVIEGAANEPLSFGAPRPLFEREWAGSFPGQSYDVMPDGSGFVTRLTDRTLLQPVTEITLVTNWFEELKRRVPTGR